MFLRELRTGCTEFFYGVALVCKKILHIRLSLVGLLPLCRHSLDGSLFLLRLSLVGSLCLHRISLVGLVHTSVQALLCSIAAPVQALIGWIAASAQALIGGTGWLLVSRLLVQLMLLHTGQCINTSTVGTTLTSVEHSY